VTLYRTGTGSRNPFGGFGWAGLAVSGARPSDLKSILFLWTHVLALYFYGTVAGGIV
jgi:hypothetical protein